MKAVSVRARVEPAAAFDDAQHRRLAWQVPLAITAVAVLSLSVDLPITRWVAGDNLPRSVEKAIRLSEVFSHGFGGTVILIAVFVLDREHRTRMPRLVAGTVLAGLLANCFKLLVSRSRPRSFDLHGQILDSFNGWLPLGRLPSVQEGFPSAHAAAGFALAVMLSWSYPAGRTFFFILAAISGLQRVQSSAHFPSDVLFGAALGCFAAYACLPGGLIGRFLDRREARRASIS